MPNTDNRRDGQPTHGRILAVTSSFPRWTGDASGCFVLNLAQDLQDRGWQVDVLAPHCDGAARQEAMGGVFVERFRYWWPARSQTVCYGGGALAHLRRKPFDFVKVPPLVLGQGLAAMRRLARGHYDLIHSHWLVPQGVVCELARRLTGTPHVATVHGGEVLGLRGRFFTAIQRFALTNADAVTVNSPAMEQEIKRIAPGLGGFRRIPMGITTDAPVCQREVAQLRQKHRKEHGPLITFVGRLVREKGVGDLIDAIGQLARSLPDLSAVLIGEGNERAAFEALAKEKGVSDRISFIGRVEPQQVRAYMAAADMFVGPSWQEPFGLVFAEALEVGTPVIATDVGGIVESVMHEKTGLLAAPHAPDEIATHIQRFVNDPGFAKRTAAAGQKLVRERFGRDHIADVFSGIFRDRVSPKPRAWTRDEPFAAGG